MLDRILSAASLNTVDEVQALMRHYSSLLESDEHEPPKKYARIMDKVKKLDSE